MRTFILTSLLVTASTAQILKSNIDGSVDMFAEQAYLRASKINHAGFSRVFNVHGNAVIKGTLRVDGGMELSSDQFNILSGPGGERIFDIDYDAATESTVVHIGLEDAQTKLEARQKDADDTGYYTCSICNALIPDPIDGDNKHRSATEMMLRNYTALPLDDVDMAKSLTVRKSLTVNENVDLGTALSAVTVNGATTQVLSDAIKLDASGTIHLEAGTSGHFKTENGLLELNALGGNLKLQSDAGLDADAATINIDSTGALSATSGTTMAIESTGSFSAKSTTNNVDIEATLVLTAKSGGNMKLDSGVDLNADAAANAYVNSPNVKIGDTGAGVAVIVFSAEAATSATLSSADTASVSGANSATLSSSAGTVSVSGLNQVSISSAKVVVTSETDTEVTATDGDIKLAATANNKQILGDADGLIKLTSVNGNVELISTNGEFKAESGSDLEIKAGTKVDVEAGSDMNVKATNILTVEAETGDLDLKASATDAKLTGQTNVIIASIVGDVQVTANEDLTMVASTGKASLTTSSAVANQGDIDIKSGAESAIRLYGRDAVDSDLSTTVTLATSGVFARDPVACGDITQEQCGNQVVTMRHATSTGSARYEYMIQILANTLGLNFTALELKAEEWVLDPMAAQKEHDNAFKGINPLTMELGKKAEVEFPSYYNEVGNRTDYDNGMANDGQR